MADISVLVDFRAMLKLWLGCTISLALVLSCFGQADTGSLSGRVTDPSDALVTEAAVTIRNVETGLIKKTASNGNGAFEFTSLPVGQYTLEAEHAGFKTARLNNIVIAVANRISLTVVLTVGETTQTVDVSSQTPILQTETSDTGTVFQPKFMKDAPLFVSGGFRNPENFINYVPGVNGGQQDTSINGGARRSKEILIDGASHSNPESGGVAFVANGGIGSVEMYGEFKVLTSNFSAEYGRSGGGIEVFVTKSGTNDLHGTMFDFLRNDKFDAAGWSVNQRTPFLGKSKVRQNEFGVSIGGPVFIPKFYNGRNKSFFYFTWNGYRQNNGGGNIVTTVPTVLMKTGNFSELGSRLIYDPATTRTVDGILIRDAFPGNIIPQSRFSSVSKNILALIPDATGSAISNNYGSTSLSTVDRNIYSVKGDHAFSERNRISGLYSWQRVTAFSRGGLPGPLASGLVGSQRPDITRLNHDFTFTPTLLNHFTFGFSRYRDLFDQLPEHLQDWPTKLGLKGVATNGSQSFPIVTFATDGYTPFGNNPKNHGAQENYTTEFVDGLTWVKGKHEFKAGYEYHRGRTFQVPLDDSLAQGLFSFSSLETANPTARPSTGNSFASFLLGGPDNAQRAYNTKGVDNKFIYHGTFLQDNWKVTRKLTLNLGLRWEVFVPRTDTNLTVSAFDPTVPNAAAGGRLGALSFAGVGAGRNGHQRFGNVYLNNFGPRIGLAYQLTQKTVLRGGYGMYYSSANGNTGGGCFPCSSGVNLTVTPSSPDGISPAFLWDGGFPGTPPSLPNLNPSIANGTSILVLSKEDGLAGRIQNWQINIQRELPKGFLLDVAYLGSKGSRLNSYVPYNQVDPKYLSLGSLLSLNINDPLVVAQGFKKPYDTFTGSLAQSLRPFPQYLNLIHTYLGTGGTTYNSLQTKFEKRYSALNLLAAYTWSKNIELNGSFTQTGNGTAPQDQYNLKPEKYLSIQDYPHVFNLVYTLDLPFGKGRKFMGSSNRLVNGIVGGWTLAGIQQYRSGNPLLLASPVNTLGTGVLFTPALRVITTGAAFSTGVDRTALDPNNPSVRYFNRAAFAVPGAYQFGSASPYLNNFRNPPLFTEALSLVKRVKLFERADLEYRADISNLFNRTSFGGINVNLNDPNFGRATNAQQAPRIIQMALRLNF